MLVAEFPWSAVLVGLGAFMAGAGSVLSGIAALRAARKEPKEEEHENKTDVPLAGG